MTPPLHEKFIELFQQHALNDLIHNAHARTEALPLDGLRLPVTVLDEVQNNCYVVSPHAGIVEYGQDETAKLPFWLRPPLKLSLKLLSAYLRFAKIDRLATLNNYCLSTNTFAQSVLAVDVARLTQSACERYPQHSLMLRSLNAHHHSNLLSALQQHGWQLITSRQVYLFDDIARALQHRNTQRDFKLLQDDAYRFRLCHSAADYQQAQHWYNGLYLQKYSPQNVQFSALALQAMHERGILDLYLLEHQDGESMGVLGMVEDDGIMTAPIVGYDLTRAQNLGLYRRIIAKALRLALEGSCKLHLSSGAPHFKRLRGALPCIEYSAVYSRHLPLRQKHLWQGLQKLSPYYAQLLQHYQL